ncbi:transporter [Novosphingobium guangzhouense]|uniref:transporter n=1 Tax=Novosphingobium guangzhouense TaxID=1850347 RepID=UPI001B802AD9|nr:transporter [Novosphingobium guangzhouense]
MKRRVLTFVTVAASWATLTTPLHAQEAETVAPVAPPAAETSSQGLADQLANPVANLISVPFQFNYDCCYGPADGDKLTVNIQPVIPISVGSDWNLITRTILPVVTQGETVRGVGGASGLGDTVQSFFLSPKNASNGFVWGVGPVILWPTGADAFSAKKFGAGPTAVMLKQGGGMTFGLLANHIWSFADAGNAHRPDVSATFIQPFVTKTLPDSTAFGLNVETSYDWKSESWVVPVNATVSHVFAFGKQPVSLGVGARYYAERPEGGPSWGARFVMTLLFPK